MSALTQRHVTVNGHACRVLEKGDGPLLGYLGGLIGVPQWTPFLDELAKTRRVVCPSLPGFPGATGYEDLDSLVDWLSATLDLLEAAGLSGADLVGHSVGATLAAEIAALSPGSVKRLALLAPLGLHEADFPIPHFWARKSADFQAMLCVDQDEMKRVQTAPEGENPVEWNIVVSRAIAAGSRLLWPMCDLGLAKRLHRIACPVLVVIGDADQIVSTRYLDVFSKGVAGPVTARRVAGAGHLLDLDAPVELAALVSAHFTTVGRRKEHTAA
ncbi:MAG TPA: alpha/beta fold hydrolase [Rhizomicrobium sp.]|jgi:pimeloyl-ACP methyl ester carboxylesterase